jgi:hypothetical protein
MQIIETMQARLREIDQLELEHIHTSIPREVVNEAAFADPEAAIRALSTGTEPGSIVRVQLNPEYTDIRQAIHTTGMPSLSYNFENMRAYIRQANPLVLGIPAYLRGGQGGSEVATELALIDTATQTRNGVRISILNDFQAQLAKKHMAIWEQFLPVDGAVPVEMAQDEDVQFITRESIGMPLGAGKASSDTEFFYQVVGHSPTENHKMVQLQKLQQYMQVLLQSPNVDPAKLVAKLLELLGMDELYAEAPPAPPPGMPGMSGMPGEPTEDTTATGGMPPGALDDEAILPPQARMLADGPAALE